MKTGRALCVMALIWACAFAAGAQTLVGQWDFDNSGDLTNATVGADLTATGAGFTAISGPAGGGGAVSVGVGSYYAAPNPIGANGNGALETNAYTLVFDVRVATIGGPWYCFYSADPSPATSDGEIFIKNSGPAGAIGVGTVGYSTNTLTVNTWRRVVISFTVSGANITYDLYVDGALWRTVSSPQSLFLADGRFGLNSSVNLFADDNGEDGLIDVSVVALYNAGITASQATALGSAGDPISLTAETPLAVSTHPTGGTVIVGDAVTLTSAATGGTPPYTYQWKKNTVDVDGETAASYTIDPIVLGDAGSYTCVITDSASPTPASVTTNPAVLVVLATLPEPEVPPAEAPITGILGLGLLAGGVALVGISKLRKK